MRPGANRDPRPPVPVGDMSISRHVSTSFAGTNADHHPVETLIPVEPTETEILPHQRPKNNPDLTVM